MYVKATAVPEVSEQGWFSAIAAGYNIDRTNERIVKGAFRDTIKRWQQAERDVPLAWDHGRDARDIIGSVSPSSMQERPDGLYCEGQLDIEDSAIAQEAWRSVRRSRVGLSFGYLVEGERTASDGVKELTSLDLYEITLTSVPANPQARVLSVKSERPIRIVSFEC